MNEVTRMLLEEHRNLARVLKTLEAIAARLDRQPRRGDVDRLYDICQYVRVFPDRVHHPKEDHFIFGPLERAAPEQAELLQRIQAQHAQCTQMTEALYALVQRYDRGEAQADAVRALVKDYLGFQFEHMQLEEQQVLPLAEARLDPDTWSDARRAFARDHDPLFGDHVEAGFAALRDRITRAA